MGRDGSARRYRLDIRGAETAFDDLEVLYGRVSIGNVVRRRLDRVIPSNMAYQCRSYH